MMGTIRMPGGSRAAAGQATVEFTLAFFLILMGIVAAIDVSRAMFTEHGLTRAAQVVARDLALASSTDPQTPICQIDLSAAIKDGKTQSGIGFDTTAPVTPAPCPPASGACGTQLSNASGSVTITGSPDLCAPLSIKVTISAPFTFAPTAALAARHLQLSESVTVQTAQGME